MGAVRPGQRDGGDTSLTVVVAARAGEGDERACLSALAPQVEQARVLLVRDRLDGPPPPPWAEVLTVGGGLTPELWAAGIHAATGDVVALTATTTIPRPDWISATVGLHARGHVAVGGAIEPGADMRASDWAVYFCRYAPYMLPIDGSATEAAADNGSYTRVVLARYADLYQEAFLEPFVHRALRRDGHRVAVEPDRVVEVSGGHRLGHFCRQRFRHGREHGRRRSAGSSRSAVLLAAMTAPAVPALMTARAARIVFAKRRLRGRFVRSVPLVVLCYSAWAAGELAGRLDVVVHGGRR